MNAADEPPVEPEPGEAPASPEEPSPAPPPAKAEPDEPLSLEERVRRLEDVVASLHLAPDGWLETVRPPPREQPAEASGVTAEPKHAAASFSLPPVPARPPLPPRGQPWLLVEIVAELRAILRMFFDPRYNLTWQTRLLTLLTIVAIVLSRLMLNSIPIIGGILDVILYPILLYVLYKVLSREATRYRMTSPDLPPALRL